MDIDTLIRNATPMEAAAIRAVVQRIIARPAIVVTMDDRHRYVVELEDEDYFANAPDRDYTADDWLNSAAYRTGLVRNWFVGRWLRGYGRVDEMVRTLAVAEIRKISRIDRTRVWGSR